MKLGDIEILFLGHSGFLISNGKRIMIDPYNISDKAGKADIVLISHSHHDHCSIKDIEKVVSLGSVVVCTADAQSKIMKVEGVNLQVVEVGDELDLLGVKIEVMPAYNIKKDFHPKSEGWAGYLIKMENIIIYHSGDSDLIPEMKRLTGYGKRDNQFVALLPVSGKYVMNSEEASEAASLISADISIPMHYGAGVTGTIEDAQNFVELCKEKGLRAEILEKI